MNRCRCDAPPSASAGNWSPQYTRCRDVGSRECRRNTCANYNEISRPCERREHPSSSSRPSERSERRAGTHTPRLVGSSAAARRLFNNGHQWLWAPAFAGATEGLSQQIGEITPFEIFALDQLNFPVTFPSLQLLLASDGFVWAIKGFDVNKTINTVGFDGR